MEFWFGLLFLLIVTNISISLAIQKSLAAPALCLNLFILSANILFYWQVDPYVEEEILRNYAIYSSYVQIGLLPLSIIKLPGYGLATLGGVRFSNADQLRVAYIISVGLASIGVLGTALTPIELRVDGKSTGLITIFYFLSSFSKLAEILFVFRYAKKEKLNRSDYLMLLIPAYYYFDFIFYLGKRTGIYDLLSLYFLYGYSAARSRKTFYTNIIISICLLFVFSMFVKEYRLYTKNQLSTEEINEIVAGSDKYIGPIPEMTYAAYLQHANYLYGENVFNLSRVWNSTVQILVPSQFVGDELKASLFLDDGVIPSSAIGFYSSNGLSSYFTGELFASVSIISPLFLIFLCFILFKCYASKSIYSNLIYVSFFMSIPYVVNFGLFSFTFYLVRVLIVYIIAHVLSSAIRSSYASNNKKIS